MELDVQDVIRAVAGAVQGSAGSSSRVRDAVKSDGGGLSGMKGLAAGAGAAALAPIAIKGAAKLAKGLGPESLGDAVKSPTHAIGAVTSDLGDRVSSNVMHRVTRVAQGDDCTVSFAAKIWGRTKQFTANIETQRPNERIKWRVSEGMHHTGVVSFDELGPNLTRVLLSFDVQPGGMIEKAARGMRHVKRAARGDLHRFAAFIEMAGRETGAWRGVIADGKGVEQHDPGYDKTREYTDIDELVGDEDSGGVDGGTSRGQKSSSSSRSAPSHRSNGSRSSGSRSSGSSSSGSGQTRGRSGSSRRTSRSNSASGRSRSSRASSNGSSASRGRGR